MFSVASDMFDPHSEIAWMTEVSRESGRPVTFACLQSPIQPDNYKLLIELADGAAEHGARIVPQVAGRPACVMLGWESSAHPFMFHSAYKEIADLPHADRVAHLRKPEVRRAILDEQVELRGLQAIVMQSFHRLYPLGDPPDFEPGPDKSVLAMAEREGRPPAEVAYDLMLEQDGRALLYFPLIGYAAGDFDALEEMLHHPTTVLGLGATAAPTAVSCATPVCRPTCSPTGCAIAAVVDVSPSRKRCIIRLGAPPRSTASTTVDCWHLLPGRHQRDRFRRPHRPAARDGLRPSGRRPPTDPARRGLPRHHQVRGRRS